MTRRRVQDLPPRQRALLDALYRRGPSTASALWRESLSAQALSTVRTHLRDLERKGVVRRRCEGKRFIYSTVVNREVAGRDALKHVLETYYGGSVDAVVKVFHEWATH